MTSKVFIPQRVKRFDHDAGQTKNAFDFSAAAQFGELKTILDDADDPLFLALLTPKIRESLAAFSENDYLVAVGDPSVIAGVFWSHSPSPKATEHVEMGSQIEGIYPLGGKSVSKDIPSNFSPEHKGGYGMLLSSDELNRRIDASNKSVSEDLNANAPSSSEPVGINYFDDAPTQEDTPPATLARLSILAQEARSLESEITADTVVIEEKKGKLDRILRKLIPGIMDELGLSEFKLTDGAAIKIKESINANITAENKPAAYAWLTEHNYDGIIKTKVISEFGRGEIERAKQAVETLKESGVDTSMDQSIHPMTLKAFVRERLEAGESIPVEEFGIFEFKEAKITLPKKRK